VSSAYINRAFEYTAPVVEIKGIITLATLQTLMEKCLGKQVEDLLCDIQPHNQSERGCFDEILSNHRPNQLKRMELLGMA
jgi:hypothetical protein